VSPADVLATASADGVAEPDPTATDFTDKSASAIALTMRHRAGLRVQDISRQVSVRARDRVRIVKIPPLPQDARREDGA